MSSTPPSEKTAPRNIGTQCEKNYFIGSRSESKRVRKFCERLWLKENLKKYLRLGVQVTDPLLNMAKWIAYITEIGAIVIVVSLLLLHLFVIITNESESFREFEFLLFVAFLSWIVGLMAFCYLHFIWILPSRRLLVGLQQLSAVKFLPWILTTFIHSLPAVPIAWLYFTWLYFKQLSTNDAFRHWIFGFVLAALMIAPQVIVLAAQCRVSRLSKERLRSRRPSPSREPQAVTSLAAPLQPEDERNSRPEQDVCLSQERQEAVSLTVQMTSPRNIGTQCENIDLESGSENVTMTKGLCFTESLKKYFGLGVQVSDPLLNAAKWIAYITEVKLEIFLLSKKKSISFKDWCHRYSGLRPRSYISWMPIHSTVDHGDRPWAIS